MTLTQEKISDYTVYNAKFANLTDLYDYLKSDPEVNTDVFHKQASLAHDRNFHGEPLDKAIEYIISGYDRGFDNFLLTCERLSEACNDFSDNRKLERGLYGGIPLSSLVAAGVPDCMLRYERDTDATVRNIFFTLAYSCATSTSEIINRGLATLFIINALEKRGDLINFKACETSIESWGPNGSEIANIEIILKRPGEMFLDIQKCYFPIVSKEFLRRILFRVLESIPVENDWMDGYGRQLEEAELRSIMNIPSTDIIIPPPRTIGIRGNDIYEDTIRTIKYLNLENEFDIEKIKKIGSKYN